MPRRVLNIRARDIWTDGTRRAVLVGGCGDQTIQVRISGVLREFSFRYFVRRFRPTKVKRYRTLRA